MNEMQNRRLVVFEEKFQHFFGSEMLRNSIRGRDDLREPERICRWTNEKLVAGKGHVYNLSKKFWLARFERRRRT